MKKESVKKENWFKRHPLLLTITMGVVAVVCLCYVGITARHEAEAAEAQLVKETHFLTPEENYFVEELYNGIDKLYKYDKDYIVTTYLAQPSGNSGYYDYVKANKDSYNMTPDETVMSADTAYQSGENLDKYVMTDYYNSEKDLVTFLSYEDGEPEYFSSPDSYAAYIADRSILYAGNLVTRIKEFTNHEEATVDIGNGEEKITFYQARVDASAIREVLEVGSYTLFYRVAQEAYDNGDEGMYSLFMYYCDAMHDSLTFSDGTVLFGLDSDGMLKYISISTGGIGSTMQSTKCVITDTSKVSVQNAPATPETYERFYSIYQDLADEVAQYDNIEEAFRAIYGAEEISDEGTEETGVDEVNPKDVDTEELVTEGAETTSDDEAIEATESVAQDLEGDITTLPEEEEVKPVVD